ncbi:apoptosis regulator BAX-like isoform X2 [Tubulanus polymorphus]|uniref:apoptosis regulator BAX-like isoform X2 n=1 Tax=Tubulanus polymorphus TaxID=672921 RepID=UPI003DA429AF
MAEGGQDPNRDNPSDHPLNPNWRRLQRSLSRHDIGNQSRFLLHQFIHERLTDEGLRNAPDLDTLVEPGTPSGPPIDKVREVARCLRMIGDELDQDDRLQCLISEISPESPQQTFMNVAKEIFSDGIYNWGRVVTLFYFAFKMVRKALDKIPLIKAIIDWVVDFIIAYVAPWIIERGGWEAIQEYFGTPAIQTLGVFLSGIICSAAFIWWKNYK